jgi:hypothetical protein
MTAAVRRATAVRRAAVIAVAAAAVGCVSAPEYRPLANLDTVEIGINPFRATETRGDDSAAAEVGLLLPEYLAGGLQELGFRVATAASGAEKKLAKARFDLSGTVVEADPGSLPVRLLQFLMFGIKLPWGKAELTVRVEVIDRYSGRTAYDESLTVDSAIPWGSGSFNLKRCSSALSRKFARNISQALAVR